MLDYSTNTKKKCKKYYCTAEEVAFADLIISGYSQEDAYQLIFRATTMTNTQIRVSARKLVLNDRIVRYMSDARVSCQETDGSDDIDEISLDDATKENTLMELLKAKAKAKSGSDEWLKIQDRIINITQMKKDEVKDEDKTTHFFLPLTCNNCALYIESKKKQK